MILERSESEVATGSVAPARTVPARLAFPQDLCGWSRRGTLMEVVRESAARACGDSWLNLLTPETVNNKGDDLLVLVSYCYLRGIYHSIEVLHRLDTDDTLEELRGTLDVRPEQVRRFRREHRRALTDCLTHALVTLWQEEEGHSTPEVRDGSGSESLLRGRMKFAELEPFYLQAQDRIDRAVVLDSMALDC